MDGLDFHPADTSEPRPRTLSVLGLIALAAGVFSYLWAYCLTDALVAAEVLSPISRDADPRPKWLVTSWFVLMISFVVLGYVFQCISARQLSTIDAMQDAEEQL